jgi:hypothetical protein
MTDEIVDRLKALPPPAGDVPGRYELVRRRVVRRRRVRALVAGVGAVALLSVGVPLALARPAPAPLPVASPSPTPAVASSTCPAKYLGSAMSPWWVPAKPVGFDGRSRLVPPQAPTRAVMCWYRSNDPRGLSGKRELTAGLAQLATDLTWLPYEFHGQKILCGLVGSPYVDDYLIALSYPGGGTIWVSTQQDPNDCTGTSNGQYLSASNSGPQFAASYAAGSWVPAPPPPGVDTTDPCSTLPQGGRRGQETVMVPPTPVSVLVCNGRTESWDVTEGLGPLVAALNAASTHVGNEFCPGGAPHTRFYDLVFRYAVGPDVDVFVFAGCAPGIGNGSLSADATAGVVNEIDTLTAGPPSSR